MVLVVDTTRHRRAVLLSPAGDRDAHTLYRDDQARFQSELLLRDAKPLTGLMACQARSQAQRAWQCHARVTAVPLAKLEARQQQGHTE